MARKNKSEKDFWDDFENFMEGMGEFVEKQVSRASSAIQKHTGDNSINQVTINGQSTSTIVQGGNRIEIKTANGKTTIKVNGKEYVEKGKK